MHQENTPEWTVKGKNELLKSLGYDLESGVPVYEQFLERHYEALVLNPAPKQTPMKYRKKPGPPKGSKFINGKMVPPSLQKK